MGLNYYADGTRNFHTHVLAPSCQRWSFAWVAGKALPIFYRQVTSDVVGTNLFDQAVN